MTTPFICDACAGTISRATVANTRLCDSHEMQWARRDLKVPAGNIISARTHFRLERARETGEVFISGQPEDLRPWLTQLLESVLGNAGRGSVRGLPHTDGPHGSPTESAAQRVALCGLADAVHGSWSASPRTWDHIVRLDLE